MAGAVDHVGDLLDDLDAHGVDTTQLRSSADDFVLMWERAASERSGPVDPDFEPDLSGITELPSHYEREQAMPQECGEAYCPGALLPGETCRFDAECESGSCGGAGDCGMPRGVCD